VPIDLHCNHCGKHIRAPDEAGGKHGKCPYCKQDVYVPMPAAEIEEIPLAPLDGERQRREQELSDEDRRYQAAISHEDREPPEKPGRGGSAGTETAMPLPRPDDVIDVPGLVVRYVLAMTDSKLDQADRIAAKLEDASDKARDEVQRLMVDELPPAGLGGVPPAVYKGFLKTLLGRL
jgi:hypothetical protein